MTNLFLLLCWVTQDFNWGPGCSSSHARETESQSFSSTLQEGSSPESPAAFEIAIVSAKKTLCFTILPFHFLISPLFHCLIIHIYIFWRGARFCPQNFQNLYKQRLCLKLVRSSWETRHDIYELRQLDLVAVRNWKRQGTDRIRQVMSVRGKAGETTREE